MHIQQYWLYTIKTLYQRWWLLRLYFFDKYVFSKKLGTDKFILYMDNICCLDMNVISSYIQYDIDILLNIKNEFMLVKYGKNKQVHTTLNKS